MERFVADLPRHSWLKPREPREERKFDPQSMRDPFFELPVDLLIFHTATDGGEIAQMGRFFTTEELLQSSPAQFGWKPVASWSDGSIFLAADHDVIRLRWNDLGIECETVARSFSDFVQRLSIARGEAYWCLPFDLGEVTRSEFMRFQTGIRREGNIVRAIDEMRKQNQRLRSSKKVRRDEFLIRPSAQEPLNSAWPEPLRKFYQTAAGIEQTDSWTLWPPERVHVLDHTHGRWLVIGDSGNDLILLDRLADRGVALLTEDGKARWLAPSLTTFLTSATKISTDVQGLPFWIVERTLQTYDGSLFWPDEISARQPMLSDPSRTLS